MGFQQSLPRQEFASVRYGPQSRCEPIVDPPQFPGTFCAEGMGDSGQATRGCALDTRGLGPPAALVLRDGERRSPPVVPANRRLKNRPEGSNGLRSACVRRKSCYGVFHTVSQVPRRWGAPSPASATRWDRRRCWGSHCCVLARRKPQIVALTAPLGVLSISAERLEL
jgi:hypothetical protein